MFSRQITLIRNKKLKASALEITDLKNRVIYPLPVIDCDDDYSALC